MRDRKGGRKRAPFSHVKGRVKVGEGDHQPKRVLIVYLGRNEGPMKGGREEGKEGR
jgi:hypothetical protein